MAKSNIMDIDSSGIQPALARLTGDKKTWVGQHFLSVKQMSREAVDLFLNEAEAMRTLVSAKGKSRIKCTIVVYVYALHHCYAMSPHLSSGNRCMDDDDAPPTLAGGDLRLQGRVLGSIFFEPSTRTTSSFQAAFQVKD